MPTRTRAAKPKTHRMAVLADAVLTSTLTDTDRQNAVAPAGGRSLFYRLRRRFSASRSVSGFVGAPNETQEGWGQTANKGHAIRRFAPHREDHGKIAPQPA